MPCNHVWQNTSILPYDGDHAGPAAGGTMRRAWCSQPGCTHAIKAYASAGYGAVESSEHPQVTSSRLATARATALASLPIITCARGGGRVVDVDGIDCTGIISLRTVTVEVTWASGRMLFSVDEIRDIIRAGQPGRAAFYAGLLEQAEQIARKSWAR